MIGSSYFGQIYPGDVENLVSPGAMTGSASASASASGTLAASGALTGSASAAASASGTPRGTGALTGSASAAATASGVFANGSLTGSASASASASGSVKGLGALVGSATAGASATGTLSQSAALIGSAFATAEGWGFLTAELPTRITGTFNDRWGSGLHIGEAKPEQRVEIRRGRFNRRYAPWYDAGFPVDAVIGSSDPTRPWQAFWEPTTDYVEVPNVSHVELGKNFDQRGLTTATITIENIAYLERDDGGGTYHTINRGYLSPLRGYVAAGRTALVDERGDVVVANEWFDTLNRNCQVTVHQAYGDESVKTFTGLIDDVDATSRPDVITLNLRCFGQVLADEEIFGWNIDKDLRDPVTFIDKDEADNFHKGGTNPEASSEDDPYFADNVNDGDSDTYWRSQDHTGAGNTEWVEIRASEGRYSDFWLGTEYPDLDIYISVKPTALANGLNPTLDGGDLTPDEWVDLSMGTVPGAFGGIPYIRFIDHPNSAVVQVRDLNATALEGGSYPGGEFVMGDNSIIRVSFRNLYDLGAEGFRAAVRSFYTRRRTLDAEAQHGKWIRVGDVSDIVKVLLRWAGFKEWAVESAGVRLQKRFLANRQMKYLDVIDKIGESLGYEFFMGDPTEADESIGMPTFRKSLVVADGIVPILQVTDDDLLTAVDIKETDEPWASIIRTRGRTSKTGETLGGDTTQRIMFEYRPPWSGVDLAGQLKHVIQTNPLYKTMDDLRFAAYFIALQEALESVVVGGEIPAHPGIDLDDIIVLKDLGTGLTSRLQLRERRSTFTTGENAAWTMTFSGALVDSPDVQAIVDVIRASKRDGS